MKFRESFAELTERLPLLSWVATPNDNTISRFSTISTSVPIFSKNFPPQLRHSDGYSSSTGKKTTTIFTTCSISISASVARC